MLILDPPRTDDFLRSFKKRCSIEHQWCSSASSLRELSWKSFPPNRNSSENKLVWEKNLVFAHLIRRYSFWETTQQIYSTSVPFYSHIIGKRVAFFLFHFMVRQLNPFFCKCLTSHGRKWGSMKVSCCKSRRIETTPWGPEKAEINQTSATVCWEKVGPEKSLQKSPNPFPHHT